MTRSERLWAVLRMSRAIGLLLLAEASKGGWGLLYVPGFPGRKDRMEIRIRRLF